MMQFRKIGVLLVAILFMHSAVSADVPPDPGYVRQIASLTLETKEDLSEYRFFIESPMGIDEIKISKGEPTVINGTGRGGAARVGTLWAIPRTTIGEDFGASAPEKLQGMRDALKEGRMYRAVKLFSHSFQTTIREEEKGGWKDPVYRIEKDKDVSLKAVHVSGGENESKTDNGTGFGIYSREVKTSLFWATIIGGALMTLALICLGAWFIRRSKVRSA